MAEIHKIDLGFRPRQWQAECYRQMRRFSVLVVHRRGGKTVMAVMRTIDAALRTQRKDARYAYIAPLFKQAKDVAWTYLTRYARMIPGSKVNESETWVELGNGARIRIYGSDNPDSLRGIYLDGVVLDEVAQMKAEVWDEIVLPTLSDRQGWALFIGTPKGVNRFSELYDTARGKSEDWFAALYDVYQTDALPASEVAIARAEMSESSFRQEYLCDFAAANENTLIPLSMAQDCRGRFLREDAYRFAAKIIGVDVARQGADSTVIQRRQGLVAYPPKVLKGADAMQVASAVAAEQLEWDADAIFVDGSGGYGAGVIDRLKQLRHDVQEVQFGGKPTDPRYLNKRAEMYWGVREWLQQGAALPDDAGLVRELCAITYTHDNARGVLKLESKDDLKDRIGISPDKADALALTFAYPVAPRGSVDTGFGRASVGRARIDEEEYA